MSANVLTVDPADLPTGAEAEIALIPGNEFVRLRVVSEPGGAGSGTVTSVAGTAPIVITGSPTTTPTVTIDPATDLAPGSMSAADKTKIDGLPTTAWDYDGTGVPPGVAAPELSQQPSTTGAGAFTHWRTQSALVGSGGQGGWLGFIHGYSDAGASRQTRFFVSMQFPNPPPAFTSDDPISGVTNVYGISDIAFIGGGVSEFALGLGTDFLGTLVAGAEITAGNQISIATEFAPPSGTPITIQPAGGFGGQTFFRFTQDQATGLPVLKIGATPSDNFPVEPGAISFSWMSSSGAQGLMVQRDLSNTTDLEIVSRHFGDIFFGNNTDNIRVPYHSQIIFEWGSGTLGAFRIDNGGTTEFAVINDANDSVVQGSAVWPPSRGARRVSHWQQDTNTMALQNILVVGATPYTPPDNSVTQLEVQIQARDSVTGDFACFRHQWSYGVSGGVINAGAGVQPAAVDVNHSTLAVGIAPQFAISGGNIELTVTPWTTNSVHWDISLAEYTNTGIS